MLHLFNRVYVTSITDLEAQSDNSQVIMITDQTAVHQGIEVSTPVGDDSVSVLARVRFDLEVGRLLFSATTFDALLKEHFNDDVGTMLLFLLNCNPEHRLVIYCDDGDIERLIFAWVKTILPNITQESMFTVARLLNVQWKLTAHSIKKVFYTPMERPLKANIASVPPLQLDCNEDKWNAAEALVISNTDKVSLTSVEWLMGSYLYHKLAGTTYEHAEVLTQRVTPFIKKRLMHSLVDDKLSILEGLMHSETLLGQDLDITDLSQVTNFIDLNPQYKWIFDIQFHTAHVDYAWETYDIAEVYATGVALLVKVTKDSGGLFNNTLFPALQQVFRNDFTVDDVINVDVTSGFSCLMLASEVTDKTMNRYILDFLFNAYANNDSDLLMTFHT